MTTTTTPGTKEQALHSLNFIRGWLDQLLDTLSDDQMMHQPSEGCNHGLWVMGHLAWCDDSFRENLGSLERHTPAEWKELFGYGSTPSSDASKYPPVGEMRDAYNSCRTRLLEWVDGMDETKLAQPLPDDWKSFAPTYGAMLCTVAAHEGVHLGQVTMIRRSLGMKPVTM